MNAKLKEAIEALSRLPEDEQEELAQVILLEIETADKWDASFARSQDLLQRMAEEAMEEYRAGETEPLDPDKF
jgi:aspartate/glutamate racemase